LYNNSRDRSLVTPTRGGKLYISQEYKILIENLYFSENTANNNKKREHPTIPYKNICLSTRENILRAFEIVYNFIQPGGILNITSIIRIQSVYFFDVANLCEGDDNFNKVNKIISDIVNIQTNNSAKFGDSLFILMLHGNYSRGLPVSPNANIIVIDSQCNGLMGEADDFILYTLFEYFIRFKENLRKENMFVVSNDNADWKTPSTALRGVPQFRNNVLIDIIQKTTPNTQANAFVYLGL
jgi:hypothetical protein